MCVWSALKVYKFVGPEAGRPQFIVGDEVGPRLESAVAWDVYVALLINEVLVLDQVILEESGALNFSLAVFKCPPNHLRGGDVALVARNMIHQLRSASPRFGEIGTSVDGTILVAGSTIRP